MSLSVISEHVLTDYRLIDDESKHKTYACSNSGCTNIVESAQMLNCDTSYHKKIKKLFCSNCAVWWQQKNECPVTHHKSPIFQDNEQFDIPQLRAICPYSLKFQQRLLNINGGRVEDKQFDEKEGDGAAQILITNCNVAKAAHNSKNDVEDNKYCNWRNKYKKLEKHVNECVYRPVKCEYIGCMAKLIKMRYDEHKENHLVQHLDIMNQTVKSLDNEQQVFSEECQSNKEEIITALNESKNRINDINEQMNKMNIQSHKVKKEAKDSVSTQFNRVTVGILVLLLSMIVFVLFDKFYIPIETEPVNIVYDRISYQLLINELKSSSSESQIRIFELESINTLKDDKISQLETTVSDLRAEINDIWKKINAKPPTKKPIIKFGASGWKWWIGFVFKVIFNFAMVFLWVVAADPLPDNERVGWLAGYLFGHFILLSCSYNFDYWIVYVLTVAIQYIGFTISIFKDSPGPNRSRRLDPPVIILFGICSFINFCVWYYFYHDGIFYFIYMICYGFWWG